MGEFERIARFFAPLSGPEGLGLKDDAALFTPTAGCDLVLTKDMLVESVHVPDGCAGNVFASRALRTNLSDLAAKGAEPLGYLLGLSAPKDISEAWLKEFADQLAADQRLFGISLWGGDSVSRAMFKTVSITAVGQVPSDQMIKRGGAQCGDDIYVSGAIGGASVGLGLALAGRKGPALSRYTHPIPRLELGAALRPFASAAADVSDGLVADIGHIAHASQLTAALRLNDIPIDAEVEDKKAAIIAGDDYELAFCAGPEKRMALFTLSETLGLNLTRIGRMVAQDADYSRCTVFDENNVPLELPSKGYDHGT